MPSRPDRELTAPGIPAPARDFISETMIAYEAGSRTQAGENAVLSLALFYNVYDELRITALAPTGSGYAAILRNAVEGHGYGAEAGRTTKWPTGGASAQASIFCGKTFA